MNIFVLHGQILRKEPPKRERGASLVVIKTGPERRTQQHQALQAVNQVIVRIPHHLSERLAKLAEGCYVELFGHVGGVARRNLTSGETYLGTQLIGTNIQEAVTPNGTAEGVKDGDLFNRFLLIGMVRGLRKNTRETGPDAYTLLQIGQERPDEGRSFQHVGTVNLASFGRAAELVTRMEAGDSIHAEGHITGLMRRVPSETNPDQLIEHLEVGLVMDRVRRTALVTSHMLKPWATPEGNGRNGDEDAA